MHLFENNNLNHIQSQNNSLLKYSQSIKSIKVSRLALKIVIRTGSRQSAVGSRGKSLRVIYNLLHSYIYLCPPT